MATSHPAIASAAQHRRPAAPLRLAGTGRQTLRQQLEVAHEALAASRERDDALRRALESQGQAIGALTARVDAALHDVQAALSALEEQRPELREQRDYRRMIARMREAVESHVPARSIVAVADKGDAAMLEFTDRTGWHFPRTLAGDYVGYSPGCGQAAVAQLETARAFGADYLVLPQTSLWWMEHYEPFRRHVADRYRRVVDDPTTCLILALREAPAEPREWAGELHALAARCREAIGREPAALDWGSGLELAAAMPQLAVFQPPVRDARTLPYLDATVDIVALPAGDAAALAEARRVAALAVVAVGTDRRLTVEWRAGAPVAEAPSCSIIIPTFNAAGHLERCLRALRETLPPDGRIEIVVVDDASADETPELLERWSAAEPRIRALRNDENAGFIRSCNRGAAAATGEALVFLNNDTIPLPGWLPPLLRTLRERPDADAVGGKLIFPDGRLQEAGGVIFSDGSGINFGKFDCNPCAPLYSFVREVDYCSGALLATPRELFQRLRGFDTHYAPAYYEDTDYCFRLRRSWLRVYYQPASAIVHLEGGSCGTDTTVGVKRYQAVNRGKFVRRWRGALKRQPPPSPRIDEAAAHALTVRAGWEGPRR